MLARGISRSTSQANQNRMSRRSSRKPLRALELSLERSLTIALIALATLFALMKPISAIDLTVFLRMGAWMAEHGTWLEREPFAISALEVPFQNGTWLAQWLLYQIYHLGGYPTLQILLALTVCATLSLAASHVVARGGWKLAGPGTLFVLAFLLQNLAIRPQSFSVPLFALLLLLLDRHPDRWFTPPVVFLAMALWSNLHGAFPIAFALPAAYWLEDRFQPGPHPRRARDPRRWWLLGALMFTATLVNPYGPAIYRYILENSALPVQRGLAEWLPPDPATFLGGRFFLALGLTAAIAVWARRQLTLSDLVLISSFTLLAVRSQRMIVWWGLVIVPILAGWLVGLRPALRVTPKPQPLHTRLGYGMLVFWAAMFFAGFPGRQPDKDARGDYPGLDRDTPVAASSWIAGQVGGRLFHRLEWGSYLMWRLWPAFPTFIDIRVWIFPDEVWNGYLSASRGEGEWQSLMDRYRIDYLLLSRETQQGLIDTATRSPAWQERYRDEQAVVFARRVPSSPPANMPASPALEVPSTGALEK